MQLVQSMQCNLYVYNFRVDFFVLDNQLKDSFLGKSVSESDLKVSFLITERAMKMSKGEKQLVVLPI